MKMVSKFFFFHLGNRNRKKKHRDHFNEYVKRSITVSYFQSKDFIPFISDSGHGIF